MLPVFHFPPLVHFISLSVWSVPVVSVVSQVALVEDLAGAIRRCTGSVSFPMVHLISLSVWSVPVVSVVSQVAI